MKAVVYPHDFLSRPCDRRFLLELRSLGVGKAERELLLYRIWADFATGEGMRREVNPSDKTGVPVEYRIMEQFCEWEGDNGAMVEAGIASGFLLLTEFSEGKIIEANGFSEHNRIIKNSIQKKGSQARVQNLHAKKSAEELQGLGELFHNSKPPVECSDEKRRMVNGLALQVWRALGLPEKQKPELKPDLPHDLFVLAAGVIEAHSEESIQRVLRYLIGVRNDAGTPKRVDAVFRDWHRLDEESKE